MFNDIDLSLKMYPAPQDTKKHWIETQEKKCITIKIISKTTSERKQQLFDYLLEMGYGMMSSDTYAKITNMSDIPAEQVLLKKNFNVVLK